jgi:hypothetical protein
LSGNSENIQPLLRFGKGDDREDREFCPSRCSHAGSTIRDRGDRSERELLRALAEGLQQPTTTFADVQKFFDVLEDHIAKRLAGRPIETTTPALATAKPRPVTKADIEVLQRTRDILDSPSKWNRRDDQNCETQTNTVSLYCAIKTASKEVPGTSGAVMQEARAVISEMDPKELKYKTRLTDYNNDPAVTFADLQKFFQEIEVRLTKRLAAVAQ